VPGFDRVRPPLARPADAARRRRTGPSLPTGLDPATTAVLRLQGAAGNAAVAQLVSRARVEQVQREPAVASPPPAAAPAAPAAAAATPSSGAPGSPAASAPGDAPAQDTGELLYPIWDKTQKKKVFVDAATYELERKNLERFLRFLAKEIPEDAKNTLEQYPYPEISDEYKDIIDSLNKAGDSFAKGDLLRSRVWANDCKRYTGLELKGWKLFQDESALSYVGKRVGAAVIGFFEGAAEAMVGLIDQGAGLVGLHPDFEEKIHKRYDQVFEAYGEAAGLDTTVGNERNIGRIGGKVAENLATGKAMGELGALGKALNLLQAGAGVKGAVETVIMLKESGKTWSEIASNPVVIAQVAGALAGVAGAGGSLAPEAKAFLDAASGVLTVGQIGGLTVALSQWEDDPKLTPEDNRRRKTDMIADLLTATGTIIQHGANMAEKAPAPERQGATVTEAAATTTREGTGGGHEQGPPEQTIRDAQSAEVGPPIEDPQSSRAEAPAPAYDPASAGIRPDSAAALNLLANQLDVVIKVRPVNLESVPHLDKGALSKMELVKAKTLNALDELIGGPVGKRGLVGLYEPRKPSLGPETPPEVVEKANARYEQRLEEWQKLEPYYAEYAAEGLVSLDDGVLKVADPRTAGGPDEPHGAMKAVAGDIDIFDITHGDGSRLSPMEQEVVVGMLQSMGIGVEHGAHMWWEAQSPQSYDPKMDASIRSQHTEGATNAEQLVAFAPGEPARPVWAGEVVTGAPRPAGPDGQPAPRTPDGQRAFGPLKQMDIAGAPALGTEGPGRDGSYVDIGADLNEPGGPAGPEGPTGGGAGGGGGSAPGGGGASPADPNSRFDLSETESAGQNGQVAPVASDVSSMKPRERLTMERMSTMPEFAGRRFRRSPDTAYDYIDDRGRTYDQVGEGARAQYQRMDGLKGVNNAILEHVRTPGLDFTVIDLVGYSADQIDAVRAYLRANHAADRGRIIAIGFDW
jgi:hypothetical protein